MLSSRLSARRIVSTASHRFLPRSTSNVFAKSIATSAPGNVFTTRRTVEQSIQQRTPSSLQQQIRNRCSCASHNTISATHVVDGTDKSVMSVCQGGHSKPKGPEGDAYRLPTNGEHLETRGPDSSNLARHSLPDPLRFDLQDRLGRSHFRGTRHRSVRHAFISGVLCADPFLAASTSRTLPNMLSSTSAPPCNSSTSH